MYVIPVVLAAAFALLPRPSALLASAAAGAFFAWQATFSNWLWLLLHRYWYVAAVALVTIAVGVVSARTGSSATIVAGGVVAIAGLVALPRYGALLTDRAYLASVTTVAGDLPSRVPR